MLAALVVLLVTIALARGLDRGPLFIIAGTLIFAVTIRPLGLVIASFVSLVVSPPRRRGALDRNDHLVRRADAVLLAAVPVWAEPAAAALAAVLRGAAMDLFVNLAHGFSVALSPMNIMFCLIGALVGTLIGVLPGIGPLATIAMLLPITFGLPPVGALIMLAGIYYGAQYGGSTTSILINIPGEVVLGGDHARRPPDGEDRAAPVPRLRSRRSARSSPAASRPCWSRRSARRSPRSR